MWNKKFKLLFIPFSLIATIPFAVSCAPALNKEDATVSKDIIDEKLIESLNNKQIVTLNNYYPFILNSKKQLVSSVNFEHSKIVADKNSFNLNNKGTFKKTVINKQPITNSSGIEIGTKDVIDVIEDPNAPKMDINDFFYQYNLLSVQATSGYVGWLTNTLPSLYKKYYSPVNLKIFPDIQTIIFKLIDDMSNGTWASTASKKFFDGYYFNFSTIRAKSWLNKPEQKKMFETLLLMYINTFNTDVTSIKVNFDAENITPNRNGDTIAFKIDCFDKNNKSLLTKKSKDTTFYIFGFRNYKYNPKFGVGQEITEDKLFNEYLVSPVLRFKLNNIYSVIDINSFVSGAFNPEFTSVDGLNYFLNNHKDIIELQVPDYKKQTDKAYRFMYSEVAPYFGTRQVLRAKIEVIHTDSTKEYFWWLSSDFDDHGHKMKPLIYKIRNQLLFKQLDKKIPMVDTEKDMLNLEYGKIVEPKFTGIDANDFYNSSLFRHILETIDMLPIKHIKMAYDLKLWNNNVKYNYEAGWIKEDSAAFKYLETWLNLFVLQYAINTKVGDLSTKLDHIKIEIVGTPYSAGRVGLKFHFIAIKDGKEIELLNKQNQNKIVFWNGFKGYTHSLDVPFSFQ